jgi:transposase
MPEPRLPMRKVRDVLRLSAAGLSKRKIATSLGMSATAARDCIWRARRAGLAWPLPAKPEAGTSYADSQQRVAHEAELGFLARSLAVTVLREHRRYPYRGALFAHDAVA